MAVTYESFVEARPEFRNTDETLVTKKLEEAARRVSPSVWGDRADDGVSLLAAHLLWTAPFGATTRLEGDRDPKEKSRYWTEFKTMVRELGIHFMVT